MNERESLQLSMDMFVGEIGKESFVLVHFVTWHKLALIARRTSVVEKPESYCLYRSTQPTPRKVVLVGIQKQIEQTNEQHSAWTLGQLRVPSGRDLPGSIR